MFELPDAKRIRREDLDASSEDEASAHDEQQDAELLAKLHARMAGMLDLSGIDQAPAKTAADEDVPMTDDPEEFEFRLFTTTDPATKIALVDEDERALLGDGAMLRGRPLSYYIAGEPTAEARAELAEAAVSGEEVLARARQRWWGMEMPWRVTRVLGASGMAAAAAAKNPGKGGEDGDAEVARRRRPGKKKRVALRARERERKKKAEEQERAKMGKEEALKEKKKRLNRLKKLRKRAKAKDGKKGDGDESGSGFGSDGGDE